MAHTIWLHAVYIRIKHLKPDILAVLRGIPVATYHSAEFPEKYQGHSWDLYDLVEVYDPRLKLDDPGLEANDHRKNVRSFDSQYTIIKFDLLSKLLKIVHFQVGSFNGYFDETIQDRTLRV